MYAYYQVKFGNNGAASPFTNANTTTGVTIVAPSTFVGGTTVDVRLVQQHIPGTPYTNGAPEKAYEDETYGASISAAFASLVAGREYLVRLHFAELFATTVGARVFNISINGQVRRRHFDIIQEVRKNFRATVLEFIGPADASGTLTVALTATVDNAKFNAIEILEPFVTPAPATTTLWSPLSPVGLVFPVSSGATAYTAPISETWTTYSESLAVLYRAKATGQADTVTLSESLAATLKAKATAADTVTLSETGTIKYSAKTSPTDTVTYSDSLTNPSGSAYTVSISTTWTTYSESLAAVYNAKAALADTVTLSESLAATLKAKVALSESAALTESIAVKFAAHETSPGDTVALSAALAVIRGTRVQPADTVTLSEALASKLAAHPSLSENVVLFETLTNPSSGSTGNSRFFLVQ